MVNPFTDYVGDLGGGVGSVASGAIDLIMKILIGLFFLGLITGFFIYRRRQKNYNIPLTIWIPRSNNRIVDEISGKGGYFSVKNEDGGHTTVFRIKRKGTPIVEIPPPSSHFLIGLNRKLYLIQKGVDDFEPVEPSSFRYVTTSKGRKIPITDLKCINQDATAWVEDNRESAKKRFTFHGLWEKYKDFIQMSVFMLIIMIALYINWQGLGTVAEALQNVADQLSGKVSISGGG